MFTGRTGVEAETPILGHLMQRTDLFEMTLMLGKVEGRRRKGRQKVDMSLSKFQEFGDGQGGLVCCSQSTGSQRVRDDLATEQRQPFPEECIIWK